MILDEQEPPSCCDLYLRHLCHHKNKKTYLFLQINFMSKVHFQTELEAEDDFELEDV